MTNNSNSDKQIKEDNFSCYKRLKEFYHDLKEFDEKTDYSIEEQNYNRLNNKDSAEYKEREKELIEQEKERLFYSIRENVDRAKHKDEGIEDAVQYILNNYKGYNIRSDFDTNVYFYVDSNDSNDKGLTVKNGITFLHEICNEILDLKYSKAIANRIIDRVLIKWLITKEKFDEKINKNYIGMNNGIFDIKNKILLPFDQNTVIKNKIKALYDPKAKCPKFIDYLNDVIDDERDRNLLQEYFGYTLLNEQKFRQSLILVGDFAASKNMFVKIISYAIGKNNVEECSLQQLDGNGFYLSETEDKMIVYADEPAESLDGNIIKKYVNHSPLKAQVKGQRSIIIEPKAKLIFSCNQTPNLSVCDNAVLQRLNIVEFKNTYCDNGDYNDILKDAPPERKKYIKKADPSVFDKLTSQNEQSGILNWMLEGLFRILKHNGFVHADSISMVLNKMNKFGNGGVRFTSNELKKTNDKNDIITNEELLDKYYLFCKKNKLKIGHKKGTDLYTAIQEIFGLSYTRLSIIDIDGKRPWGFKFLKFINGDNNNLEKNNFGIQEVSDFNKDFEV